MQIIPTPGSVVLDPETYQRVPPQGQDVPDTEYWQRRLRDGDVVLASTTQTNNKK